MFRPPEAARHAKWTLTQHSACGSSTPIRAKAARLGDPGSVLAKLFRPDPGLVLDEAVAEALGQVAALALIGQHYAARTVNTGQCAFCNT